MSVKDRIAVIARKSIMEKDDIQNKVVVDENSIYEIDQDCIRQRIQKNVDNEKDKKEELENNKQKNEKWEDTQKKIQNENRRRRGK